MNKNTKVQLKNTNSIGTTVRDSILAPQTSFNPGEWTEIEWSDGFRSWNPITSLEAL